LKLTKKSLRKKGEAETFGLFLKYQEISQWRARKFFFKLFVTIETVDKKTYKKQIKVTVDV
jgi:hypothetical protein